MSPAAARLVARLARVARISPSRPVPPLVGLLAAAAVLLACAPIGGLIAEPEGEPPTPSVAEVPPPPAAAPTVAPPPAAPEEPDAPVTNAPGAPTVAPEPPAAPPAVEGGLAMVEGIDVLVLESFPVQVHAVVTGSLPDPCTRIGVPSQVREGNAITVTLQTLRDPEVVCAQVIAPFEVTVPLAGEFPGGSYTVTVNGVTRAFEV